MTRFETRFSRILSNAFNLLSSPTIYYGRSQRTISNKYIIKLELKVTKDDIYNFQYLIKENFLVFKGEYEV